MANDRRACTFKSLAASLLAILLITSVLQFAQLIGGTHSYLSQDAIPGSAALVMLGFAVVSGIFLRFLHAPWLTREELYFVLFAALLATPVMGRGFWANFFPMTTALVRENQYEYLRLLPSKLWPHGENVLAEALDYPERWSFEGNGTVLWPASARAPHGNAVELRNGLEGGRSAVFLALNPREAADFRIKPRIRYLLTVEARASGLGENAIYYCRIHMGDAADRFTEIFSLSEPGEATYIQPEGFRTIGRNDLVFSLPTSSTMKLELGFEGRGEVAFRSLKLTDIDAIATGIAGRSMILESDVELVGDQVADGMLVKPDRWLSWRGLVFLLSAFTPVRDWFTPVVAWGSITLLLLCAAFSGVSIMREQWVKNEHYPLPWMQVEARFLEGAATAGGEDSGRPFRLQPTFWMGFGASFIWCALQGLNGLNPEFPYTKVKIPLAQFISDPGFGDMWAGVHFYVSATILGLALFMELHVCLSLIVGYFLFRSQLWFAQVNGIEVRDFPFPQEQGAVAYLVYGAVILLSVRRYLWRYLRSAWNNERKQEDLLMPREALLMFVLAVLGTWLWALWMRLSPPSVLLVLAILLAVLLTAAKLRAECGIPHAFLFASQVYVLIPLLGGLRVLGSEVALFGLLFFFLFTGAPAVFILPGIYLEAQEMGRRFRIHRSHVLATIAVGLIGGFCIGGWAYFGLIYANGTENLSGAAQRRFSGELRVFHQDVAGASEPLAKQIQVNSTKSSPLQDDQSVDGWELSVRHGCLLYAGGITAVLSILRQLFAGFWFHPVGFLIAYTPAAERIWGSVLMALLFRFAVLKLGGARAVRERLQPFALGVFLAAVLTQTLFALVEATAYFQGAEINYFWGAVPF